MKKIKLNKGIVLLIISFSFINLSCNDDDDNNVSEEEVCFEEYTYDDTTTEGPSNWDHYCVDEGTLNQCGSSIRQSPIDIVGSVSDASLEALNINYEESITDIVYNGHTIEFEYEGSATLTFKGDEYALAQFHFHADSEHTVAGEQSPLEVHLVHVNSEGNIAVVGVFFELGAENAFLAQFIENIPSIEDEVFIDEELSYNALSLLPESRNYFNYSGSLTTPPCSEIVDWIVMEQPIEISQEQLDVFSTILKGNFRPIQPIGDRVVGKYTE